MTNRWLFAAALAALVIASGCSLNGSGSDALPDGPSQIIHEGDRARTFDTLGQLAATAKIVVRGEVIDVREGNPITFADGSGITVTPRLLLLDVQQVLMSRSGGNQSPTTLEVNDGYWQSGEGYAREGLPWAQPGDVGVFFLTQDRDRDLNLLPTYSLVDTAGRVLFENGHAEHATSPLWAAVGSSTTPDSARVAIDRAVQDARSGRAKPVTVTICRPSVRGDENSEPVCIEE